jgi:MFS transporter, DHA2 family, multidrug resistance protein
VSSGGGGGGDPNGLTGQGLQMTYNLVQQQAGMLAYMDMYRLFALASILVLPLAFLMKKGTVDKELMTAH